MKSALQRSVLTAMFLALLVPGTCPSPAAAEKTPLPNFIVIIADDLTYRDIGCYGGQAFTPNMDRLATQGLRFTRCFQAAPMCSPTRHCLYTGIYPVKTGAYPNHTFAREGTLSVVQHLKPLGYRVALTGKTHIAPKTVFPFEYSAAKGDPDFDAIEKLMVESKAAGTPFCQFICSHEPHSPWNKGDVSRYKPTELKLPPHWVDTPETRDGYARYLAETTVFDEQVGQCVALLEKHGLAENTLLMVLSEQGSSMPFGKWTLYDTGLQSGCIVRWPGKVKAGAMTDAMIEYVDVVSTFLDAAGGQSLKPLDGRSFLPVLLGKSDRHKDYVFGIQTTRGIINGSDYFGIRSVRGEQYKYVLNLTPEMKFQNACTKSKEFESWRAKAQAGDADAADKVRRYEHRPGEELYDIVKDPYEWNNLAGDPQLSEIKANLRAQLDAWMKDQGDRGQATELEAKEHQGSAQKKDGKKGKKKDAVDEE